MTDREPPIQFRDKALARQLAARVADGNSLGSIAARDLARYYALLSDAAGRLDFSAAEWGALREALQGYTLADNGPRVAWMSVADAILHDGLADRWGIDGPRLVERVQALSPLSIVALIDALEQRKG